MYIKTRSHFTKLVRIRPEQLFWLEENKDTRTIAGYLDKIINLHKAKLDEQSRTTVSDYDE